MNKLVERLRVEPGEAAGLDGRDTRDTLGIEGKDASRDVLEDLSQDLDELHQRLWAEGSRSVLLVLQGMDAAGKDGTIRRVLSGLNPQGCQVASFKAPSDAELDHDYLWRVHRVCPDRGHLGVFNRSHYEDVVAARIFGAVDHDQCRLRYRHIREFERMLVDEGTTIVKVFLHLSKDEQRERLQARLAEPGKNWKFNEGDLDVRKHVGRLPAGLRRGTHRDLDRPRAVARGAGGPEVGAGRRRLHLARDDPAGPRSEGPRRRPDPPRDHGGVGAA